MCSIKCKNVERVFLLEACANEDFAYVLGAQSGEDCEETSLQGRVIFTGRYVKWIDGVMLG